MPSTDVPDMQPSTRAWRRPAGPPGSAACEYATKLDLPTENSNMGAASVSGDPIP